MRALALLLALLFAPQAALANVAAFSKPASGVQHEISPLGVRDFAGQPAEARPENAHFYGESTSGIVDDPINNRDPTGRLRVSSDFARMYPKATEIIKDLLDSVLVSGLREMILGGYRIDAGASEEDVRNVLTWGQGPLVESRESGDIRLFDVDGQEELFWVPACGQYDQANTPEQIDVDPDVLLALESGRIDDQQLVVTLLHEVAHYLDQKRPPSRQFRGEAGQAFETFVFNKMTPCLPKPKPIQRMMDRLRTNRHPSPTLPKPF